MKKEGTKEWTFESPNQGTITIVHYSGDETNGLVFPSSEEEVLNNLEKAGKSKTDYAVVEYKKNTMVLTRHITQPSNVRVQTVSMRTR